MTEENQDPTPDAAQGTEQAPTHNFAIQRIYTKDVSFETPNSPQVFTKEWKPEITVNMNTDVQTLGDSAFEVNLTVTVTAKQEDLTAYLVEVKQSGIFIIQGYSEEEMGAMMGIYCPNTLFPYAREVVSSLVTGGSFPQFVLSPVNFEAIYAQRVQEQKDQAAEPSH